MNPARADRAFIARCLPHGASMSLLDAVVNWDEQGIDCLTRRHRDRAHPLRTGDGLHVIHAIEYAAQATAVHGALCQTPTAPRPGRVASVREFVWQRSRLDAATTLHVHAHLLLTQAQAVVYGFRVTLDTTLAASGELTVAFGEATS